MSRDDPADLDGKAFVYVLQYGNYEPAEIHSIHATAESAEAERDSLDDNSWEVVRWEVRP
jgi:hypothetical protein